MAGPDEGLAAVPAGSVCLLTTYGPGSTLHTRPVAVWPGTGPYEVVVLTDPDAAKVAEVAAHEQVSLGGQSADGWWSAEGLATVDPDATGTTLWRAGLPEHLPVVAVRIELRRLREWTVTGDGPWDNTYAETTLP